MGVILNQDLCIRCGVCAQLCNMRVFTVENDGHMAVNDEQCFHCGHCYALCPARAISLDGHAPDAFANTTPANLSDQQQEMLFKSCRSVRRYKPDPLSEADLARALDLANYGPTARNKREVQWTVINGREKLVALVNDVANALRDTDSPYAGMVKLVDKGLDPVLRGAPCLILAHAEPWEWAEVDCSINTSWLELALHSMGIGSCWCGILIAAAKAYPLPHLPLPKGHIAYGGLMVGYPDVQFTSLPPRSNPVVHFL